MQITVVITISAILSAIPSVLPLRYCLSYMENICFPCDDKDGFCDEIANEVLIIRAARHEIVNYTSYVNSSVKIIEENHVMTYYSCPNQLEPYFQVNPINYYPLERKLNFTTIKTMPYVAEIDSKNVFQACLNTYCSKIRNNQLKCHGYLSKSLLYSFDSVVTPECIQNITSVRITSDHRLDVERSRHFFHNAYNLVFLRFDVKEVISVRCNVFQNLKNLREIQLVLRTIQYDKYKCLFRFNPGLVKVEVNDKWIWNQCLIEDRDEKIGVDYSGIIICIIVAVIVCTLIGYSLNRLYKKYSTNIENDHYIDHHMCRVYMGNSAVSL